MKLTLLGTGTPSPNPRRRGNSQVIESGGELVLIDVGATAAHRLVEAGYNHVCVHQVGPDQQGFIRFYEREVLPEFAGATAARSAR